MLKATTEKINLQHRSEGPPHPPDDPGPLSAADRVGPARIPEPQPEPKQNTKVKDFPSDKPWTMKQKKSNAGW